MAQLQREAWTAKTEMPALLPASAHENIRWLHDYWERRRIEGRLPTRGEVDPLDMPRLLPTICLLEVASGGEVRLRLAGTAMRLLFGREVTGDLFMELFPDIEAQAAEARALGEAIRREGPVYREGLLRWRAEALEVMSQRLYLPMTRPGEERTTMVLWGSIILNDDGSLKI